MACATAQSAAARPTKGIVVISIACATAQSAADLPTKGMVVISIAILNISSVAIERLCTGPFISTRPHHRHEPLNRRSAFAMYCSI